MTDIQKEKKTVKILSIIWLVLYCAFGIVLSLSSAIYIRQNGNIIVGICFAAVLVASLVIVFIPLAAIIHKKSKLAAMKAIRIISKIFLIFTSITAAQGLLLLIAAILYYTH